MKRLGEPKTEDLTEDGWALLIALRAQEHDDRDAAAKTDACIRLALAVIDQSVKDAIALNLAGLPPLERGPASRRARRWLESEPIRRLFADAGMVDGDWRHLEPLVRHRSRYMVTRRSRRSVDRMAG